VPKGGKVAMSEARESYTRTGRMINVAEKKKGKSERRKTSGTSEYSLEQQGEISDKEQNGESKGKRKRMPKEKC